MPNESGLCIFEQHVASVGMDVPAYIKQLISSKLKEADWLNEQVNASFSPSSFYLSFNLIHRKVEEQPLTYTDEELASWNKIYPGFNPAFWTAQTLARTYLVLHVPETDLEKVLDDLFTTGDIGEQEALYRMLFLLPEAQRFQMRAAEGIRTNMTRVFDAIALDNPYPSNFFNGGQWNQMVLKSIFMERPLFRIQGLELRNNEDLCRIAQDFAHERWAAGRKVTPELWRLTGIFISGNQGLLDDLSKVLSSDDELEQEAGKLALAECDSDECRSLLEKAGDLTIASWDELGKRIALEK